MTEPTAAHRATWWVWAGDEKIRYTATMRGQWGFDVSCSCGWESRTGGATRRSVREYLDDHRADAQAAAETPTARRHPYAATAANMAAALDATLGPAPFVSDPCRAGDHDACRSGICTCPHHRKTAGES